jgi:hypothetical protein
VAHYGENRAEKKYPVMFWRSSTVRLKQFEAIRAFIRREDETDDSHDGVILAARG